MNRGLSEPRIAMMAALSENRVIGRNNALPWHISADLKHFKQTTMGKPLLMGRKTYESIGRPLPGRANIVLTARRDYAPAGVSVAHSETEALAQARQAALDAGADEVMVIGGERLYRSLLSHASRLYLTEVHRQVEGDAYFPDLDAGWREVSRENGSEGEWRYSFVTLVRNESR